MSILNIGLDVRKALVDPALTNIVKEYCQASSDVKAVHPVTLKCHLTILPPQFNAQLSPNPKVTTPVVLQIPGHEYLNIGTLAEANAKIFPIAVDATGNKGLEIFRQHKKDIVYQGEQTMFMPWVAVSLQLRDNNRYHAIPLKRNDANAIMTALKQSIPGKEYYLVMEYAEGMLPTASTSFTLMNEVQFNSLFDMRAFPGKAITFTTDMLSAPVDEIISYKTLNEASREVKNVYELLTEAVNKLATVKLTLDSDVADKLREIKLPLSFETKLQETNTTAEPWKKISPKTIRLTSKTKSDNTIKIVCHNTHDLAQLCMGRVRKAQIFNGVTSKVYPEGETNKYFDLASIASRL